MQDAKEEVRARLNIEDVIGEYVPLKRAGRNFKGLSPFTGEKTPSFYISPDKQIWHDFSSNKGGDIFSFVMEAEGMEFRAALEHLARKAGVDMSMYDTKDGQEIAKRKKRLFEANELAVNYYQHSMMNNKHAIDYVFSKRGLSKDIVQKFKIGYAPSTGEALTNFMIKKGFTKKELTDAGLLNRFGSDLFRGRVMIPLMDSTGQILGFTGRIINDDPKAPKYLNTPQTLIYDKGRHVFGLSQAKEAIRTKNNSVIVEGNLDVISSHQAGVTHVVATAGTAMTENHLKALVRLSNRVKLAFDGDAAGLAATERAIPIAQAVGVDLYIVTVGYGAKDPDELIKLNPKLWQNAIDGAEPAIDWIIKQYSTREDLTTAVGKRQFTTAALELIGKLNDSVEREHYITKVAELSESSVDAIKEKVSGVKRNPEATFREPTNHFEKADPIIALQDNLLAMAVIDGAVHDTFRQIDVTEFDGDERRAVVEYLANHGGKPIKETPEELKKYDIYVKILLLRADARYAAWNDHDRYFEAARLIRQIITEQKKKQKELLTNQLRDAETLGDDPKADEIRAQLNQLIKEIQSGQK